MANVPRPIHIDSRDDVEKFDPKTGKWERADLNEAGIYRASFRGRRYFCRSADGEMNEVGYEIAKILSARREGVMLHGYNEQRGSFECVVGCQPPGLYRRALVSYSGRQARVEDGRLIYSDIPRSMASLVLRKLYG